jgi:SAM-dependent methyltransferase
VPPTPASPTDTYAAVGEFHDLFMDEAWDRLVPALARAFGALDAGATVLDLGAGSGVGTRRLAEVTRARIVAVEPSATMRSVLLARVVDDPALTDRVSVVAGAAPAVLRQIASLVDGALDGIVCAHVLGHLDHADRAATLGALAGGLAPDGHGVITLPPPSDASPGGRGHVRGWEIVDERMIGRHRYVSRRAADGATGRMVSTYEVWEGERLLRAQEERSGWSLPPLETFIGELDRAGLAVEEVVAGAAVVRRR